MAIKDQEWRVLEMQVSITEGGVTHETWTNDPNRQPIMSTCALPDLVRVALSMKERLERQGCSAPGYSADYEACCAALRKAGVLP